MLVVLSLFLRIYSALVGVHFFSNSNISCTERPEHHADNFAQLDSDSCTSVLDFCGGFKQRIGTVTVLVLAFFFQDYRQKQGTKATAKEAF